MEIGLNERGQDLLNHNFFLDTSNDCVFHNPPWPGLCLQYKWCTHIFVAHCVFWSLLFAWSQIRKRQSSGSMSEDKFAASAREYVESLHQNSRVHLLYGKNNVLVQPVRSPAHWDLHLNKGKINRVIQHIRVVKTGAETLRWIAGLSALIQMHTVISQWLGFPSRKKVLNCCKPKGTLNYIRSVKSCYKSSEGAVSTLICGKPVGDTFFENTGQYTHSLSSHPGENVNSFNGPSNNSIFNL